MNYLAKLHVDLRNEFLQKKGITDVSYGIEKKNGNIVFLLWKNREGMKRRRVAQAMSLAAHDYYITHMYGLQPHEIDEYVEKAFTAYRYGIH